MPVKPVVTMAIGTMTLFPLPVRLITTTRKRTHPTIGGPSAHTFSCPINASARATWGEKIAFQ